MEFTSTKGCLIKFKISNLERNDLITEETDLCRSDEKEQLKLKTWWVTGQREKRFQGSEMDGKRLEPDQENDSKCSVAQAQKKQSHGCNHRSPRPDVGVLRFGAKQTSNPLKEFRLGRGSWRRGALSSLYHSCSSYR